MRIRHTSISMTPLQEARFQSSLHSSNSAPFILCLPLITKRKLIGVLYLENNLTPSLLATRDCVLKLLASKSRDLPGKHPSLRHLQEREAKIRRLVRNIIGIVIWKRRRTSY